MILSCVASEIAFGPNELPIYQTTGRGLGEISLPRSFGDHIGKVPPVPIPNTEVKLSEPMIVPTSVKVGLAIF